MANSMRRQVRNDPGRRCNAMRKDPTVRWREMMLGLLACAITLVFSAAASARESLRAELIRWQEEEGLTLAWVDNNAQSTSLMTHSTVRGGVRAVSFKTRSVVPLKNSLQAFQPDGFSFEEFPEFAGIGMCWSHDQTKLVSIMFDHSTRSGRPGILDLKSKQTRAVPIVVDKEPMVTSQCWSQNDKEFVSMRPMAPSGSTILRPSGRTTLPKERTPVGRQTENGSGFGTATRTTPRTPMEAKERSYFAIIGALRCRLFTGRRTRRSLPMSENLVSFKGAPSMRR